MMQQRAQNVEHLLRGFGRKGKFYTVIGIVLVLWNIGMIVVSLWDRVEDISVMTGVLVIEVATLAIGAWLLHSGLRYSRLPGLHSEYHTLFYRSRAALEVQYSEIATRMGKGIPTTRREVDLLIRYKLWDSVHGGYDAVIAHESAIEERAERKADREALATKTVQCADCGGATTVRAVSIAPVCSYCGASLADELEG